MGTPQNLAVWQGAQYSLRRCNGRYVSVPASTSSYGPKKICFCGEGRIIAMDSTPGMFSYGRPLSGLSFTAAILWQKSQCDPRAFTPATAVGAVPDGSARAAAGRGQAGEVAAAS